MPEQLKLLYDGQCSLCRRAMEGLKRRDAKGRIVPEDISDPAFDPARYGLTAEQVRTAMHVVLPDGRILRAMDAFARPTRAVGLGWLVAPTGWPGIRWLADGLLSLLRPPSPDLQPHVGPEVRLGEAVPFTPTDKTRG